MLDSIPFLVFVKGLSAEGVLRTENSTNRRCGIWYLTGYAQIPASQVLAGSESSSAPDPRVTDPLVHQPRGSRPSYAPRASPSLTGDDLCSRLGAV